MADYTLKYRTFEALLSDVKGDFKMYQLEDLIDPQEMIKVVKKVNYDLGLRINKTKEVVLEVEKGRIKLPNDFYTLNFMLMCGTYETKQYLPQGTHIEERIINPGMPVYQQAPPNVVTVCQDTPQPEPCDPCLQCGNPCCEQPCNSCCKNELSCTLNCKGESVKLVQTMRFETRVFTVLKTIRLLQNAQDVDCACPNLYWESPFTAWIKEGWLYTNFQTGKIYLNYQGLMEDEDGNLLVLDHDMINEYYEYALKRRIIENLIMNDENVSQAKVQLIDRGYKESRNYALSIVNTPNYEEMKRVWLKNRKAQHHKYYSMFTSHFPGGFLPFTGDGSNVGIWPSR